MNNRTKSLIRNTSILTFGTICTKGLTFLMTPFFTRWLTIEDYGMFDLFINYSSLLVPIFTLSVGEAVFRKVLDEENENKKKQVSYVSLLISIVGALIAGILIIIYSLFFLNKDFETFLFFWLFICGEIFFSLFVYLLRGLKKIRIYIIGNIIYVVGSLLLASIFILIFGMELDGMLMGYFFGDILSIIVMYKIGSLKQYLSRVNIPNNIIKEILDYSLPMIPNAISWWIINVSDRTIISIFLGVSHNAIYALSNKIPALCMTFFSVFHLSWQQNATETMSDSDRDIYYSSVMNNMLAFIVSICMIVVAINYFFFELLFTDRYFVGVYQAPILVLAIVFSMLGQFIGGIYVARQEVKKNGLTTSMAAIINMIINLAFVKYLELYAASISTLIAYFALFLIRYIDIRKSIKLRFTGKSIIVFLCLLSMIIISYNHNVYVQLLLLLGAIILFMIINKQFIIKSLKIFKITL